MRTGTSVENAFQERRRRLADVRKGPWRRAIEKALAAPVGRLDTHPSLAQRLAAIGVARDEALAVQLDPADPPARDLLPDSRAVDEHLTNELVGEARLRSAARREIASIVLGRPVGR